MSEPDKKGSTWPWIAVPLAAVSLFVGLRYCQQQLPTAEQSESSAVPIPAPTETPAPDAPGTDAAAAPAPAPQ